MAGGTAVQQLLTREPSHLGQAGGRSEFQIPSAVSTCGQRVSLFWCLRVLTKYLGYGLTYLSYSRTNLFDRSHIGQHEVTSVDVFVVLLCTFP